MQSFTELDTRATAAAVGSARDHIEAELREEVQALRAEIIDLKKMLGQHWKRGEIKIAERCYVVDPSGFRGTRAVADD